MRHVVEGVDRSQITLSAESLDDNPMLIIDAFVNALALRALGCKGIMPEPIGRPSYYPAILLKLYIYDYLRQVQSSRRLPPDADLDVLRWTIRSRPRTLQFVARRRPRPAADIISFQRAHVCRNAGHQGDSSRSHTTIWAPAPEPGVPPAHSERRSRSHRPMALKIRAGAELLTLTPQRSFAASKPRYAMTSGSGALSSRAA